MIDNSVDQPKRFIPLAKIVKTLKKTGSVPDTAKILGTSKQNIYQRLERADIDKDDFTDYSEDKGLSHEILQYRIARGLTGDDIKKMPGGSKVLAICQLDDKIQVHRGGSDNKNSISIILNMACQSNEKVIEIKSENVDK